MDEPIIISSSPPASPASTASSSSLLSVSALIERQLLNYPSSPPPRPQQLRLPPPSPSLPSSPPLPPSSMRMLPPDTIETFEFAGEAYWYLQGHARDHGYAIVLRRPSNYENGLPRRYDVMCACSGEFVSKSTGLRDTSSRKTGCPFKMKMVKRKKLGSRWTIDLMCGDHNHLPDDPIAFPEPRNLTSEEVDEVHLMSEEMNMTARAILLSLRARNPDVLTTEQDIYNMQSAQRQVDFGALTATQALVQTLNEKGYFSTVRLDDEDRLKYLVVAIDWDLEMWREYPHILMFDSTYNTNRFGMKLLQVNGITSLGTVFPCCYALTHNEDADFFVYLLRVIKLWLSGAAEHLEFPKDHFFPHVIITDDAAAVHTATRSVFPLVQRQLCVWHILKNVLKAVNERWIGEKEQQSLTFEDFQRAKKEAKQEARYDSPPASEPPSQKAFLKAWSRIVYHALPLHR